MVDEMIAVQNCMEYFKKDPANLVAFSQDVLLGKASKWSVFRQEVGRLTEMNFMGRPQPVRKYRGPSGNEQGQKLDTRYRIQVPMINFRGCITASHRLKKILNSGLNPVVLKDLLTHEMDELKAKRSVF